MDYRKLSEESLDGIMNSIRCELRGDKSENKAEPLVIVHTEQKERQLANVEQALAAAAPGTQVGLQRAPMHVQKGIKRWAAKLIEKVYLRVAELSNRDVRVFSSAIISAMEGVLQILRQSIEEVKRLSAGVLAQQQLNTELSRKVRQQQRHVDEQMRRSRWELEQERRQLTERMQAQEERFRNELQSQREFFEERQEAQQRQFQQELQAQREISEEKEVALLTSIEERLKRESAALVDEQERRTGVLVEKYNGQEQRQRQMQQELQKVRSIVHWANNAQFMETVSRIGEPQAADPLFYHDFEERFRGTQEDIRERLEAYAPRIIKQFGELGGRSFIDLGCGRGEWLDMLRDHGADNIIGIDLNEVQLGICREKGHRVECCDALEYLRSLPGESVDMVSGIQIIEHLEFPALLALYAESCRVLKKDGIILFETPNPRNIVTASCWFYADHSHHRPLLAEVMQFLAERSGFASVEIMEMNPVRYQPTLREPVCFDGNQDVWDENISLLNKILYGPQDYAIIGVKG